MEVVPLNRLFGRGAIYDPDDLNLVDRALRRLDLMPTPKRGMTTNTAEEVIGGVEKLERDAGDLAIDGVMRPGGSTARRLADMMQSRLVDPGLEPTVSNPFGRADGNPWPFLVKTASAAAPVPVNRRPVTIPPLIRRPSAPKPGAALLGGIKPTVIGSARIPPGAGANPNQNPTVPPWTPPSPTRKPDFSKPDALPRGEPDSKPENPKPEFKLTPPVPNPEIRDDLSGDGTFGADRGHRKHKGVDILAKPGATIKSPVAGTVKKIGEPYASDHALHGKFKNVWIETPDGKIVKLFYVDSGLQIGQPVKPGQPIGKMQDRAAADKDGNMKNHVHIEIHRDGRAINPMPHIKDWFKSK